MCSAVQGGTGKKVAVKGFLSDAAEIQDCSVAELLRISKRQENLYHAYKSVVFLRAYYGVNTV